MVPSARFFTRTVTLERPTVVKDSAGGATRPTWTSVTGSIDLVAAVQPASSRDIALFAGRQIAVTHAVYLKTDLQFARGDRLRVSDGRIFSLAGSIDLVSAGRVFKVFAKEIYE